MRDEIEKNKIFELVKKNKFKEIWKMINGKNITFSRQEVSKIKRYVEGNNFSVEDLNYILLDINYVEYKSKAENRLIHQIFAILFGFLTLSLFDKNFIQYLLEKLISKAKTSLIIYNIVPFLWAVACIILVFYIMIKSKVIDGKNRKCKFYLQSIIEETLRDL